jgi:cation transport regulator ChaB
MPPENLPSKAKEIFVAAEAQARKTTCKDREDKDECIAKIAWSAVKSKFKQNADGDWIPKAEIAQFSMAITNTSYDKSTDTRRWKAVASDTDNDLYEDNMSLELYEDFLRRIESKELPPESFRSDFWSGGTPYLSISHYPDLNGKGVPGPVDAVYVDGKELKSVGRFDDTPIGKKCFQSISKDLSEGVPDDEKIRISIAFLDWKHKHKSNGFVFDRAESDEVFCPECLKDLIMGESEGKEFLRGHLVHLALTRVPEDAESIVEELADELEEEAQAVGKSLVADGDPEVVIKSEPEAEEKRKKPSDYEEDDEEEEDGKKKKKKDKEEKKSDVAEESPKIDKALHLLEEIKADLTVEPEPVHPLDIAISELKSVYDEAILMENAEEALIAINEPYEALVSVIQNSLTKEKSEDAVPQNPEIAELKSFMAEQIGLLQSQISAIQSQPQQVLPDGTPPPVVPERRSVTMNPNLFFQPEIKKSETPKLTETVRRSVGLD